MAKVLFGFSVLKEKKSYRVRNISSQWKHDKERLGNKTMSPLSLLLFFTPR